MSKKPTVDNQKVNAHLNAIYGALFNQVLMMNSDWSKDEFGCARRMVLADLQYQQSVVCEGIEKGYIKKAEASLESTL